MNVKLLNWIVMITKKLKSKTCTTQLNLKILYNNNIFFDQHYGGISRYYASIFEELIKKKVEFKVLAPLYKNKYLKSLDKNYKEGTYLSRYPPFKILKVLNEILSIRSISNKKYNVIHDTFYSNYLLEIRDKKKNYHSP